MTLRSMTGFARHEGTFDGHDGTWRWYWELRSVNGKGLDIRFRMPSGFEAIDPDLRKMVGQHLKRGNIQASLQLDRSTMQATPQVNEAGLQSVLAAVADLRTRGIYLGDSTAEGILGIKGVMELAEPKQSNEEKTALMAALTSSFEGALKALASARAEEGAKLGTIFAGHVTRIDELSREAAASPATSMEAQRARLKAQVDELLQSTSNFSEDRLAQEAALLATKVDIREEIDRLHAHVEQAHELLASDDPVGRRLDFLTQEFNREANTLCSKAASVDITRIGLELKAVIDQLREQVQNLE